MKPIYQGCTFRPAGGLKREPTQALRTGRTVRKPRRRPDQRTSRFVDPMIMISERPAEVEDRAVPGHWEDDLIMGKPTRPRSRPWSNAPPATRCWCTCPGTSRRSRPRRSGRHDRHLAGPTCVGSPDLGLGLRNGLPPAIRDGHRHAVYFCDPASPGSGRQTRTPTAPAAPSTLKAPT